MPSPKMKDSGNLGVSGFDVHETGVCLRDLGGWVPGIGSWPLRPLAVWTLGVRF